MKREVVISGPVHIGLTFNNQLKAVVSGSDGTNPGFGFEGFETFRLYQGKKARIPSGWFQILFFEKHFGEMGGGQGREVALFFKLREAEVIFFLSPLSSAKILNKRRI